MVVKPLANLARTRKGLAQPGVKVRGREYLRIIYGPDYTEPANLERLRQRNLGHKRSLALREYALGLESLAGPRVMSRSGASTSLFRGPRAGVRAGGPAIVSWRGVRSIHPGGRAASPTRTVRPSSPSAHGREGDPGTYSSHCRADRVALGGQGCCARPVDGGESCVGHSSPWSSCRWHSWYHLLRRRPLLRPTRTAGASSRRSRRPLFMT